MRCLWIATLLSFFQLTSAILINTTVDDLNGDPSNGQKIDYQPENAWISGAIGGCSGCSPPPISQMAYNNSFHGSLFNGHNKENRQTPLTATLTFFGTYVSVNCIVSNSLSPPSGASDMTFLIDGVRLGTYSHTPTGAQGSQPTTVFVSQPLEPKNHTLVIQNGLANGGSSLAILDFVTYSFDDDVSLSPTSALSGPLASSSSIATTASLSVAAKSSNSAAIVGGVIAALAVLLLIALAFLYIRHRRMQHRSNVPLSTSIFSPIGRIGRLWSQGPPKPPPDMAPVPFPSPAHHVSPTPSPLPPPPPAPSPNVRSRISRISFNADLLVGRFQRRPPPPSITTRQALDPRLSVPASPALRSGNALLRPPSAQPELRPPSAQPEMSRVASIQEWQRQMLEETANQPVIHPLDMSEVDLSSHYDESSISGPPAPPPAPLPRSPQPPQRRFTVMNN